MSLQDEDYRQIAGCLWRVLLIPAGLLFISMIVDTLWILGGLP